jgi:hypothetical protein
MVVSRYGHQIFVKEELFLNIRMPASDPEFLIMLRWSDIFGGSIFRMSRAIKTVEIPGLKVGLAYTMHLNHGALDYSILYNSVGYRTGRESRVPNKVDKRGREDTLLDLLWR